MASFISDYDLFQIEITKNYTFGDWRDDIRRMMRKAGEEGVSTVFLFGDHQIKVKIIGFFIRNLVELVKVHVIEML